ncbi:CHAT domain-containing protein [Acaryochloris sp. IP29b_bin.137]|uniref:CHAT domain-containing protein n=1 Tax=Acaryochloris sp. IP29b_bin.137 TaxID=2969217 RepID=UPI002616C180|nr:CHAT domain-containing protein [Acaryochloris sp. IP29b_bin.137]
MRLTQKALVDNVGDTPERIYRTTGQNPAIIYINFNSYISANNSEIDQRRLGIYLITSKGQWPIETPQDATEENVLKTLDAYKVEIEKPYTFIETREIGYKLYSWLISPVEEELRKQNINNLVFVMDSELRPMALSALYDGEKYLIEKYSIGIMPGLSLVSNRHVNLKNSTVLAAGISKEKPPYPPLKYVKNELESISQSWPGKVDVLLDREFTFSNLKQQGHQIVHFVTRTEFSRVKPELSTINSWDKELTVDDFSKLGWFDSRVNLLVLSGGSTTVGNAKYKFGFAGFAIQSGVNSVLSSLWDLDDQSTATLIGEFYNQLKVAPTKSEALRRAQVSMIKNPDFRHPAHWASYTIIGNPW